MDVRATTSAPCTWVLIQLEDSTTATPLNYPAGRHSRYISFIDDIDGWQRLEFDFYDRLDLSVTSVDRILVLFDSFVERGDEYFFRNFDSAIPGCISDCEPLSENQCRTRAKSEAGACSDGLNNDGFGYDGDGPIDCEDSDCWDDPACSGTVPVPTPTPGTATPTTVDTTDVPTISVFPSISEEPTTGSLTTPTLPLTTASPTSLGQQTTASPSTMVQPSGPTPPPIITTPMETICDDGIDNDGDGFIDCDDLDCASDQVCSSWSDPACSSHSSCSGLAADCCPTFQGDFLDCCEISPASCSVNPMCAALGLDDPCCPNAQGDYLDCCEPVSCSANPRCSGLDGDCCPTANGEFLACCEQTPGQCKIHPNCADLDGECCPTPAGEFLDCCEPAECSAHQTCSDMGLDGLCCPTTDQVYLDCCKLDIPTFAGSSISWLRTGLDAGGNTGVDVGAGSASIQHRLHPFALLSVVVFVLEIIVT